MGTVIFGGEPVSDIDEDDDEGDDGVETEHCGEEVDVVDEPFVVVGEVDAQEDHPKEHDCVEEIHYIDEGGEDDAAHAVGVVDLEQLDQVLLLYGLHRQVEGEQQNGRSEVHQQVGKVQVKDLHLQEYVSPPHLLTLVLVHLLLHLFEGKVAAVDPSLTLTHQPVDSLDGIHLCVGIRHENDVLLVLVNTHTQNTILCQIDVFVVEDLLFGVGVDRPYVLPDELWQEYPHDHVTGCKVAGNHLVGLELIVNRLEVLSEKSIFAVDRPESVHRVP